MILFKALIEVETHSPKKNKHRICYNRKTGQRFVASDMKTIKRENYLVERIKNVFTHIYAANKVTDFINCKMVFYFPKDAFYTKKGLINKKLPDLSNLYELPQDALQRAGVIENDWQIVGHDGSTRAVSFDEKYYLEIEITPRYEHGKTETKDNKKGR